GDRLHLGHAEYIAGLFAPIPYRLSGSSAACLLDPSGAPRCFGGPFGAPPPSAPTDPLAALGALRDVAIGIGGSGCAVHAEGAVTCWGRGLAGPTLVYEDPTDPALDVETSQRGYAACLRTEGGKVLCWGEARAAALLGRGREVGDPMVAAPVAVEDVERVAVGGESVCALRADGALLCWGLGPVGDGTSDAHFEPVPVLDGVTDVQSAGAFLCAITATRDVACWGRRPGGEGLFVGDGSPDGAIAASIVPPPR
ncbi:MAG: hypothetical protein KC619_30530, partial [Myxococcales bacterium]|nr:hypothetical protein [Myxococcales bacterium]